MRSGVCGLLEPGLKWLLPGQEVSSGIRDIPGMISRFSIKSPHVLGGGATAT